MSNTDDKLTSTLKKTFDESVDALDAATLSRLNRGRHAALGELAQPKKRWLRWLPATGMAAAALLAAVLLQVPGDMGSVPGVLSVTDMEILLGEDSIEMLEELEFYSWLDAADMDSDVG